MKTGIEKTLEWFNAAIPEPTQETLCIQIGCHLEEVGEMLDAMDMSEWSIDIYDVANDFKNKRECFYNLVAKDINKKELLDALCDQIVTAVGVAYMMGFDIVGALNEVNRSNFSKFEDGIPVFDANGKIGKGRDYSRPELEPFIN